MLDINRKKVILYLQTFIMGLFANDALEIAEISKLIYINAVNKILEYNMDSNDISALLLMKERGIKKIYTFNRHFENVQDIIRLPKIPQKFK